TGIATMIALRSFRLFDIIPIAYDAIFSGMQDAILLTDEQNKVIQANPAAESLLQPRYPNLVGTDIRDLLELDKAALQNPSTHPQTDFLIIHDKNTLTYDVHISPLYQHNRY